MSAPTAASAPRLPEAFWQQVVNAPFRHDLFQLLRRLDAQAGEPWPLGRAPLPRHEPLRLGQAPSLAFAPATLARAAARPASRLHEIDIYSFGLFGPNGPLPRHLTEYAQQRVAHHGDRSMVDFLNLFHHRLILLFYRAWADAQPTLSLDRPDRRRFNHYLSCLTGVGQPALQQARGAVHEHARYALAGHVARQSRDAEGLEKSLAFYFCVPVRVVQNVPQWLPIDRRDRLRLQAGRGGARLGENSLLGCAVWDAQHKFRLVFGPLALADYQRFLPEERAARQLRDWIAQTLGIEFSWDLQLSLRRQDVSGVRLGGEAQLGYSSWLGEQPASRDRDDLILCLEPAPVA